MTTQHILQSAVNFPVAIWMDAPPFAYQGCASNTFKLYMYSEDDNPHKVSLYVQGSNSIPWQTPQNKWSHLNPQWRFTDLSGNVINELTLSNATTTINSGTTGYMSSAEFYYIDDMPNDLCGTMLIWAVADFSEYPAYSDISTSSPNVPSYANSKVVAAVPYIINQLTPTSLSVTKEGIQPLLSYYWTNMQIPHVVSIIGTSRTDSSSAVMKNLPISNVYGISGGPVTRSIPSISSVYLTWTPENSSAYLSALDDQGFNVGGYLRGQVLSEITANAVNISATAMVYYKSLPIQYPYIWVSNPENNTLNRLFSPCLNEDWLTSDAPFLSSVGQTVYDITNLQVSAITNSMSLSGFNGIYGIAIDELKNIWCTDSESDKVYKFSSEGTLLSTLVFNEGSTPAGISIDGANNIWVTFFDDTSAVYIDRNNGSILSVIDAGNPYASLSSIDNLFKPTLAEPDMNSDVWVSYTNSVCSALTKYTSSGVLISSITLPTCSNPMDIHITKDNDVWVSLTFHSGPPYKVGKVCKYSNTTASLVSSITAMNPEYLSMDSRENLWFTQNWNTLTKVTTAGTKINYTIGSSVAPASSSILQYNALEGLCIDLYDQVFVIDSVANMLYRGTSGYGVKITPDNNLSWYNSPSGFVYTLSAESNKSAQAFGDWSGNRWTRKYNPITTIYYSDSTTRTVLVCSTALTGISVPFDISDFSGLSIRRFNESWDASNEVKKFARSPHIADNEVLWNKYMKAVWGDASSVDGTGFGRDAYERISNYVANHADINTCNIDQLYSLAQVTDVPIDSYGLELPTDLKRIMDIGSVNQQLLWGSRCKCSRNINNTYTTYISSGVPVPTNYSCDVCGHQHPGNRGQLFNPNSYMVTANTPFIIEDRANTTNRYMLITPSPSCNSVSSTNIIGDICDLTQTNSVCITTYPLSSYYHILLPSVFDLGVSANASGFQQIITYFCFYDYVFATCQDQIAGVINWDDEHTTLTETASSIDDWYGSGQTLEKIINYVLHKGLGLLGD